jgi:carbohydrate-selective porin OprB
LLLLLASATCAFAQDTAPASQPSSFETDLSEWMGLRPQLEQSGLTFNGSWLLDYSKAFTGGANPGASFARNLLDLRLKFATEPLLGLQGGTFSIDFQNQAGVNGSTKVGDLQGFDANDAGGRTQISELWYEQKFHDDLLRLKFGKIDATTEFAAPTYGTGYLNSSFGYSPTIKGFPTFPDPACGVILFLKPDDHFYFGFGAFDASHLTGTNTGSFGPARLFEDDESFFYIGEAGYRWTLDDQTLPGRFALGAHDTDAHLIRYDGSISDGIAGVYLILEQKLHHSNPDDKTDRKGVYAFLQYGHTDGHINPITDHVGVGATWVGPYEKTNPDTLGLGITYVRVTDDPGAGFSYDYETAFEAYYQFFVTSYLFIKPDLQYIIHPGAKQGIDNALVGTVQVGVTF